MTQAQTAPWKYDAKAYQEKLLGLLGNRDPIAVMSETAGILARIVREHTAEQMRTRPFPGKWTPNEVIGHLTDSEWVYGYRVRLILCEDNPTILGMDQELWVEGQKHNDRDPSELVEMFRSLRNWNLHVWKSLGQKELQRTGNHNERGRESLGLMIRMEAGHDLSHIDQITRYLAAVKGKK
jgi:hypothetical protein